MCVYLHVCYVCVDAFWGHEGVGCCLLWVVLSSDRAATLLTTTHFSSHALHLLKSVFLCEMCVYVCMPWPTWRSERGQLWVSPPPCLRQGLLWVCCFSVTASASYLAFELLEFPCLCLSSHGTLRLQTSACRSEVLGIRTRFSRLLVKLFTHWTMTQPSPSHFKFPSVRITGTCCRVWLSLFSRVEYLHFNTFLKFLT